MTTPSCRRMPPCRGNLRPFPAIPRHFRGGLVPSANADSCMLKHDRNAGLKARSTRDQIAANSGRTTPQSGEIRLESAISRSSDTSPRFAANSVTASRQIKANSHVCNILAGIQPTPHPRDLVSYLISIAYVFAALTSLQLTPYSRIFCRQVSTGQSLAHYPRKIFKTNDFKPHGFNILQNLGCKLLKIMIVFFTFPLRCFHHGRQNL